MNLVMLIRLAAAPRVHDPSDQDRQQEDSNEPTDERPEHSRNDT
jgi:hypothetical protein